MVRASLVGSVISLLLASEHAFHDCCTPGYLGGFVREPLRKIDVARLRW
jgi:hypothetical protein